MENRTLSHADTATGSFRLRNVARMAVQQQRRLNDMRTPGRGFRKKLPPAVRWRSAIIAVIAVARLAKRRFFLSTREADHIRDVYNTSEGINSAAKLSAILQACGVQLTDREIASLLADERYVEGHMLSFAQFRVFFQYKKLQASCTAAVVPGSAEEAFRAIRLQSGLGRGASAGRATIPVERLRRLVGEFDLQLDISVPPPTSGSSAIEGEEELGLEDFTRAVVADTADPETDWWRKAEGDDWWQHIDDWMHKPPRTRRKPSAKPLMPTTLEEVLQMNLARGGLASIQSNSYDGDSPNLADSQPSLMLLPTLMAFLRRGDTTTADGFLSPSATLGSAPTPQRRPSLQDTSASAADSPMTGTASSLAPVLQQQQGGRGADGASQSPPAEAAETLSSKQRSSQSRPQTAEERRISSVSKARRFAEFIDRMDKDVADRRARPTSASPTVQSPSECGLTRPPFDSTPVVRDCFSQRPASSPLWRERRAAAPAPRPLQQVPFHVVGGQPPPMNKFHRANRVESVTQPQAKGEPVAAAGSSVFAVVAARQVTAADSEPPTASSCLSLWTRGGALPGKRPATASHRELKR